MSSASIGYALNAAAGRSVALDRHALDHRVSHRIWPESGLRAFRASAIQMARSRRRGVSPTCQQICSVWQRDKAAFSNQAG